MTRAAERHLSIYDGTDRIGAMVARPGAVDAFDTSGVHLGTFKNVKAAAAALNNLRLSSCVPHDGERGDGSE